MILERPLALVLLPLALLGAWWLARLARARRLALAAAWSAEAGRVAAARGRWRPALLALAALAAAAALPGPRWGRAVVTTRTSALNVVLAMDISRSMLAEDTRPSRLERALAEARRVVVESQGDRLGLVAFAGRSYILTPLTVDGSAIRLQLDAMTPDLASEGGSALGAALQQGTELLVASREGGEKVLVIFTDGEAHDSLPTIVAAAQAARKAGVRVLLVAEGTPAGARIPLRDADGAITGWQRDEGGREIVTRRMDDVLAAVADAAGGTLVAAETGDQATAVREFLRARQRADVEESRATELVPRAWLPLLVAALVLLAVTVRSPGGALVGLLLALAGARAAEAQRPAAGERRLASGDAATAASAYLDAARRGTARDTAFYNAGTAALAAGRRDVAAEALEAALASRDPEVRYRALYNAGLILLQQARDADGPRRDSLLDRAAERFRESLLLAPGSLRAKWNLELATRDRPPPPPPRSGGSGGGGGGSANPQPDRPPPPGGLSRGEAEQILNSIEREERETRESQLRRRRFRPRGVRDW